ncbi:restriction endonuclease subunit S [Soehngenia longivitae]|uniref:Restriction endonuclease subunit S n=1 Tax=Soehngenia longivitae TaxID=2562294 RepID=A0A4Z0D469_9FIRM|nr:restriction endonuclease subunit S [Soehngenia longivitae]TFZ40195.1 restriction endonuclease subunit S [Soehngenia longivitae]
MNAQDLKNSILQLAIQGKLVEQREEEGTAKELIEKIKQEKKRLIKDKIIKKETQLKDLTEDDIPFDIPKNWEWVKLGEIVSVNGGKRIPAGRSLADEDTGYKYIRVADMKNGSILLDDIKYIPRDIYPKIKNYTISKDDIYITVAGTIGQVGLVPDELDNANLTENADKLVIYFNFKEFMYYMLSSNFIQYQIREHTTKVGQPKLAIKRIKELIIPLPPLEEQKRIVAKIEELMPYVDKYDVAYSELEELNKKFPEDMQKSILLHAIQGKLVVQREEDGTAEDLYKQIQEEKKKLIKEGKIKKTNALPEITEDEIPFDIPENWKWVRLGDIVNFNIGKTPPRNDAKYWNEDYNWVSIADMITSGYIIETKEKISEAALSEKFKMALVPKGTLLMSFKLTVGKVSILNIDAVHNEAIISIYPYSDIENIIRNYLFTMLPQLSTYGDTKGAIKGKTLNSTSLNNLLIPLPPLAEQKRIVGKIKELLPYTKKLAKKVD